MKNKYIDELLNNSKYKYYAHRKEDSNDRELLSSHLKLTYLYYKEMEKYKKLDVKVKNIIKQTFNVDDNISEKIYDFFESSIYYHDIGKINPLFQKDKMENDLGIEIENNDSTHAALSARIYIDYMCKQVDETVTNGKEKVIYYYAIYYFGYIISRHHTKLEGISDFEEAISEKITPGLFESSKKRDSTILSKLDLFIEQIQLDGIGIYILCKLLYSCMVISDFYATYDYMTGNKVLINEEKDKKLFEKYCNSNLLNNIRKYKNGKIELEGINKIRSDIFLEAEQNLLNNLENNIYYLEAPTGSGKTNMAINLAKILYETDDEIKSIQYIFPFNTIIEQTGNTFDNYFEKYKDYIVITSTSSMVEDVNEVFNYEEAYIKNMFRQYKIVITSHVNLFNSLFGSGKEANYSLYHLADSVVIIDEIQAYSNKIWREIIEMFSKYSSLLNIKFVIMSATLPRLDKLLNKSFTKFYPLIEDTNKYYQNQLFKNRVKLDFNLLDKKMNLDDLINEIQKHKDRKVLVECIKKDTADTLFKALQELKLDVYELTSDDNKYKRKEIIEITKTTNSMILVATQTIEAGVDIDMDIGFKDISFIDSEEQFIGRINRSGKKKNCIAYFFNLDDARTIYRKDYRLEYNLQNENARVWLKNKKFDKFYESIMDRIKKKGEGYSNSNFDKFCNYCAYINFKKIDKTMKLIEDKTIQLFLNYTININGKILKGSDVFNEYKELCINNKISYAEKKIRLSEVSERLNLFIYSIYENKANVIEGEKFGDIYYVEDGEKYIKNGRFDRVTYLNGGDGLFL